MRCVLSLIFTSLALAASAAATFNVGSYNIRYPMSEDSGERLWEERSEYVYQTIRDNEFDVMCLNEVRFGSHRDDVLSSLSDIYNFSGWDGTNANFPLNDIALNNYVAYRPDVFSLMDEGWFFLGHDYDNWANAWDNTRIINVRTASWAKLRHIESGEEFYFVATHLNTSEIARAYECQKLIDHLWELFGSAPIIVCGDMNSKAVTKNTYYLLNAHFLDSRLCVDDVGCSTDATAGWFNNNPSKASRIDYIFTRNFTVNSYRHITETYGGDFPPSDHIAITANVTLTDSGIHTYCVDPAAGSDTNRGTAAEPLSSLERAVALAGRGDTIKVTACEIALEAPLTFTVSGRIYGGYNADFTEVVGKTTLCAAAYNRLVEVKANQFFDTRNVIYSGGTADAGQNGGAILCNGMVLTARDCDFIDCSAGNDGGALYCKNQYLIERCTFTRCTAGHNGGGLCGLTDKKPRWFNIAVRGSYFTECRAADGSAFYMPKFVNGYIDSNTFTDNIASAGATAVTIAKVEGENLGAALAVFNNTFSANEASGASALKVDVEPDAPVVVINNTIVGNISTASEGALNITGTNDVLYHNIICGNRGGDWNLSAEDCTELLNMVTTRSACSPMASPIDIAFSSEAEAAEALATMLNGKVDASGLFRAELTLDSEEMLNGENTFEFYIGTSGRCVAPVIEVVDPDVPGQAATLRSVTANRLDERFLQVDFDYDGEKLSAMLVDQCGHQRPTDGTATIGAVECPTTSGISAPTIDSRYCSDEPLYNLQGIRVSRPSTPGLYITPSGMRLMR